MNVFDHPWLGGLFGDAEVCDLLSANAQLKHMLMVEACYSRALGLSGHLEPKVANGAAAAITCAAIDLDLLRTATERDGVAIPEFVRQLQAQAAPELQDAIHKGMTSQDVIDTSFVLALREVLSVFETRLLALNDDLTKLTRAHGANALMGRTRMQAALPITVADRVATWRLPIADHLARLNEMRPRLLRLQLGGAVGNNQALGSSSDAVQEHMAAELGLKHRAGCWHVMRDNFGELASWLSLVSGTLGKMGQDLVLMAQQGVDEVSLGGCGNSSAMPHKKNPVFAELLATLARYNATQLAGMHQALIHEQERSGAAWSLEWMILPQMLMTTGRGLTVAKDLSHQISRIGTL